MEPIDKHTRLQLNQYLENIETAFDADAVTFMSAILPGIEFDFITALELFTQKRPRLAIILDTVGGIVEIVERMVIASRHHYAEIYFIIPDRAMSAGTVFAMSGDKIFMGYASCLGPIDPQIEKDGKLVPALSYLNQFERLCKKAESGQLNTAEFALLNKLDLGELHSFEQARELSHDLLITWLSKYKFKDWKTKESSGAEVTEGDKRARAEEIAKALSDNSKWHSHGRAIPRDVLINHLKLKIDKIEDVDKIESIIKDYFGLLKDYMQRQKYHAFIHSKFYF